MSKNYGGILPCFGYVLGMFWICFGYVLDMCLCFFKDVKHTTELGGFYMVLY